MEPVILNAFLAIVGSWMRRDEYMDDGDSSFVAFGSFKCIVLLEDIDERMLPLADVLHLMVSF